MIQAGKVLEVLGVDCAEYSAGNSKTDGQRKTHADGARDQRASVGGRVDFAEERDADGAGRQQDEEAEDEGFIPKEGRKNLAEEDLIVRGAFLEGRDIA